MVTVPNEAAAQVPGKGEKLGVYPDTDMQRSVDGHALDAKRSGSKLSLLEAAALTASVAGSNASFGQKTLMSVSVERELGMAGFAGTMQSVNSVGLADNRVTVEQVLAAGKQGSTVEAKSLAPPSFVIPSESTKITQPISPRLEMQGALANRVEHTKIVGADQGYAGSVSNTKGEPIAIAGFRSETNALPGRSLLTVPSSFHPTVPINDGDTQIPVKVGQYAGQIDGQATRPSQGSLPNQGIAESGLQLTQLPSSPK